MPVSAAQIQTTLDNWALLINERKLEDIKAIAAPGTTWTVIGPGDKFPDHCGEKPFSAVVDRLGVVTTTLLGDYVVSFKSMTVGVDGKTAAVEIHSKGVWLGPLVGKVFDNVASVHIEFDEEGKIKAAREYLDLFTFEEFLHLPKGAWERESPTG